MKILYRPFKRHVLVDINVRFHDICVSFYLFRWASDNNFTGQIPDYIGSWNLTDLRLQGNSFQGPLPATLSNLVQLTNLRIGDIASGISSSLAFISSMTSLNTLILRNCMISNSLESIDFSKYASLTLL
jgi:hypothetical protein